jgi:outer membrane protein assembly factor BamB
MFRADPQHTGVFASGSVETNNNLLWTFDKKNSPITAPVIADGVVFFGSEDNNLYALFTANGTEKWRYTTGDTIRSVPAVADGIVCFGSGDRNIYGIDAADGSLKWSVQTGAGYDGVGYSAPAIDSGTVYIVSYDRNLYAIDAGSGTVKWKFPFATDFGVEAESSPAVADGVVYFGAPARKIYAVFAANGTRKWQYSGPGGMSVVPPGTPVVSNGVVYIGGPGKDNLTALFASNGTEKYRLSRGYLNWELASPAVSGGILYTGGSDRYLYAIDAATQAGVWTFDTGGFLRASPSIAGDIIYVPSSTKTLYAVFLANGTELWHYTTPSDGSLWGSPVIADGIVYSNGDRLYAIGNQQSSPSYITGHVYAGEPGDTGKWLNYIPVDLYGSADPDDPGTIIDQTETGYYGAFSFPVPDEPYAYYSILAENSLPGAVPSGSQSTGGTVKNASWIQYAAPLPAGDLPNNNFWLEVPPVHGNFSAEPLSGTAPLTVRFTDASTGYPTSWNWIMEYDTATQNGLITCTSPVCSYTYTMPGTYHVQMRVFNAVSSDYVTRTDYITVTTGSAVQPLPGYPAAPTDPDSDGLYEDLNANGRLDFADVVLFFDEMDWIAANEPVAAFDMNGNGRIDFDDIVRLYDEI